MDEEELISKMRSSVMEFSDDEEQTPKEAVVIQDGDTYDYLLQALNEPGYAALATCDEKITDLSVVEQEKLYEALNAGTKTPLMREVVKGGHLNILRAFVLVADADTIRVALRDASVYGKGEAVEVLLMRADDINLSDGHFHNIRVASSRRFKDVLRHFLTNPIFRDTLAEHMLSSSSDNHTILHCLVETACRDGDTDTLKLIKTLGTNYQHIFTDHNNLAIRAALTNKKRNVLELLAPIISTISDEQLYNAILKEYPDCLGDYQKTSQSTEKKDIFGEEMTAITKPQKIIHHYELELSGLAILKKIYIKGSVFKKASVFSTLSGNTLYEISGPETTVHILANNKSLTVEVECDPESSPTYEFSYDFIPVNLKENVYCQSLCGALLPWASLQSKTSPTVRYEFHGPPAHYNIVGNNVYTA